MSDIGTLGGTNSAAYDINSAGTIIGFSSITGNSAQHAFSYSGGVLTDLNTLLDGSGTGWTLQSAQAINDNGQIVGFGTIGGQTHAFLLTPEPSACAMLFGGLGLLGLVVRRRKSTGEIEL
jgi:probable HAF family extracellular repeat protein